jgi:hypothetical protein
MHNIPFLAIALNDIFTDFWKENAFCDSKECTYRLGSSAYDSTLYIAVVDRR